MTGVRRTSGDRACTHRRYRDSAPCSVEGQDRQEPGPSKIRGVELATEHDSDASSVATFQVEQVSTGAQASGFGSTEDNRPFAFRVYKRTLYLEIYRADLPSPVPDRSDVTAVAEQSV